MLGPDEQFREIRQGRLRRHRDDTISASLTPDPSYRAFSCAVEKEGKEDSERDRRVEAGRRSTGRGRSELFLSCRVGVEGCVVHGQCSQQFWPSTVLPAHHPAFAHRLRLQNRAMAKLQARAAASSQGHDEAAGPMLRSSL